MWLLNSIYGLYVVLQQKLGPVNDDDEDHEYNGNSSNTKLNESNRAEKKKKKLTIFAKEAKNGFCWVVEYLASIIGYFG